MVQHKNEKRYVCQRLLSSWRIISLTDASVYTLSFSQLAVLSLHAFLFKFNIDLIFYSYCPKQLYPQLKYLVFLNYFVCRHLRILRDKTRRLYKRARWYNFAFTLIKQTYHPFFKTNGWHELCLNYAGAMRFFFNN